MCDNAMHQEAMCDRTVSLGSGFLLDFKILRNQFILHSNGQLVLKTEIVEFTDEIVHTNSAKRIWICHF